MVALVYLANPGAGVIELIPDNLPVIGNLDEAGAIALLVASFKGLRRLRRPSASDASKDHQPASGASKPKVSP